MMDSRQPVRAPSMTSSQTASPVDRFRRVDVVGHPVAQSFVVVNRNLEKLGEVMGPDPPGPRQTSQHTLFRPVLEECRDFPRGLLRKFEGGSESVADERSRKTVRQSHELLLLGRVRDVRNGRYRPDQHVRHGYRIRVRRRLALIADFVDSFRIRAARLSEEGTDGDAPPRWNTSVTVGEPAELYNPLRGDRRIAPRGHVGAVQFALPDVEGDIVASEFEQA